MPEVTRILQQIAAGDPAASAELLPLVYDELRQLAAARLAREKPGHTLQPTALVHEAYLRLVDAQNPQQVWDSRGHFFAAAAEAMRRILIDRARQQASGKRGGDWTRLDIDARDIAVQASPDQLLSMNEALERLERDDRAAFEMVRLRYFAGLSIEESAEALGVSVPTAYRHWNYARAWLYDALCQS